MERSQKLYLKIETLREKGIGVVRNPGLAKEIVEISLRGLTSSPFIYFERAIDSEPIFATGSTTTISYSMKFNPYSQ